MSCDNTTNYGAAGQSVPQDPNSDTLSDPSNLAKLVDHLENFAEMNLDKERVLTDGEINEILELGCPVIPVTVWDVLSIRQTIQFQKQSHSKYVGKYNLAVTNWILTTAGIKLKHVGDVKVVKEKSQTQSVTLLDDEQPSSSAGCANPTKSESETLKSSKTGKSGRVHLEKESSSNPTPKEVKLRKPKTLLRNNTEMREYIELEAAVSDKSSESEKEQSDSSLEKSFVDDENEHFVTEDEQAVYLQSIRSPLVPLDQLLAGQNPNLELGNQDDDEIGVRKKRKLRVIESDSDDD